MENNVQYNEILFCRDSYMAFNEYLKRDDVDEDAMFEDIKNAIRILMKNGNMARVYDDGITVAVEFDAVEPALSESRLVWVPVEKYDDVIHTIMGGNQD